MTELTTDPNDPELGVRGPNGQNRKYLVLSDGELAKGFVRKVYYSYKQLVCGTITTMGAKLSETYAREPTFYGAIFCCGCGKHLPLIDQNGKRAFEWVNDLMQPTGLGVGE